MEQSSKVWDKVGMELQCHHLFVVRILFDLECVSFHIKYGLSNVRVIIPGAELFFYFKNLNHKFLQVSVVNSVRRCETTL